MRLIGANRIWDGGRHNAFTDLARHTGRWYCTFREASAHVRGMGKVRVIASRDGRSWEDVALFAERGVDLRDPKLSVMPDGRLMLLYGGSEYRSGAYVGRQPRVVFSEDGDRWSRPHRILSSGDWLWRVSWHKGTAYGVSYRLKSSRTWQIYLFASQDGLHYEEVGRLPVRGKPNETTVRVAPDGTMYALVRREGGDSAGRIGTSTPPYRTWEFETLGTRLGGPNFLVMKDGRMIAATRVIRTDDSGALIARTVVGALSAGSFKPELELPSGGDCSYPGLVVHRKTLWVSYYSSHEGKSAIYLARVGDLS